MSARQTSPLDVLKFVWGLLLPLERCQAAAVSVLVVGSAFMETIGIALIFPIVALIVDPDSIKTSRVFAPLYHMFGDIGADNFLKLLIGGLFAIFIVKNLYLLAVHFLQIVIVTRVQRRVQLRLFEVLLNATLLHHLRGKASERMYAVRGAAPQVIGTCFNQALVLISEATLFTTITIALITIQPLLTIGAALLLGSLAAAHYMFARPTIARLASRTLAASLRIQEQILQALSGIRETKLFSGQQFFMDRLRGELDGEVRTQRGIQVLDRLPALVSDLALVTVVCAGLLWIVTGVANPTEAAPILALFGVGAVRMVPSFSRATVAIGHFRLMAPSVDLVRDETVGIKLDPAVSSSATGHAQFSRLELDGISFTYPDRTDPALTNISLTLHGGESVGIIGNSGAGKSTFVDLLLGLIEPGKGVVKVDGADIRTNLPAWWSQVSFVPQLPFLFDDSIAANVAFGVAPDKIDKARVWASLERAKLADHVASLPQRLNQRIGTGGALLSGGQRQRLAIARALYFDRHLVVFDEATSAVDVGTEHEINTMLDQLHGERTIVVVAHRVTTLRHCDRLVFIENGRIRAAAPFDVLYRTDDEFRRVVDLSKF